MKGIKNIKNLGANKVKRGTLSGSFVSLEEQEVTVASIGFTLMPNIQYLVRIVLKHEVIVVNVLWFRWVF